MCTPLECEQDHGRKDNGKESHYASLFGTIGKREGFWWVTMLHHRGIMPSWNEQMSVIIFSGQPTLLMLIPANDPKTQICRNMYIINSIRVLWLVVILISLYKHSLKIHLSPLYSYSNNYQVLVLPWDDTAQYTEQSPGDPKITKLRAAVDTFFSSHTDFLITMSLGIHWVESPKDSSFLQTQLPFRLFKIETDTK